MQRLGLLVHGSSRLAHDALTAPTLGGSHYDIYLSGLHPTVYNSATRFNIKDIHETLITMRTRRIVFVQI